MSDVGCRTDDLSEKRDSKSEIQPGKYFLDNWKVGQVGSHLHNSGLLS